MRNGGIRRVLFCALVTLAMTSALADSDEVAVTEDDAARSWTIAMYWASDNNLDEYTDYFLGLWASALTNREDIALCVFLDRLTLPANISTLTEDGWVEEASLGEVNSSSPETLSSFITYALTEPKLASENFMLMIQDHGNGYLGLCSDEGLPDSDLLKVWMSIDDLGKGVRTALDAADRPIDIIALDACTLGTVEIAYELRGTASYLVASELGVPFDGMNYDALLSGLSDSPGIAPVDLACKLVDDYAAWYSAPLHTLPTLYPYMQDFASLSVIDLNALDELATAFASFTDAVTPKVASLGKILKTAAVQADVSLWMNNMGTWFYPDIRVMFSDLATSTRTAYPDVADACDAVLKAADDAIVHDWASWRMRGLVTGLSVFVPPSIGIFEQHWDSFERVYNTVGLDFVDATGWDTVLLQYFCTVKQYGNAPVAA
ncbi:MAG: clostripain-related cysteine peptidase [Thermoplasmata archaeon]|nr:clostripain-related cysteine peptidase [Thermoplasmata archaeon]